MIPAQGRGIILRGTAEVLLTERPLGATTAVQLSEDWQTSPPRLPKKRLCAHYHSPGRAAMKVESETCPCSIYIIDRFVFSETKSSRAIIYEPETEIEKVVVVLLNRNQL